MKITNFYKHQINLLKSFQWPKLSDPKVVIYFIYKKIHNQFDYKKFISVVKNTRYEIEDILDPLGLIEF